MNSYSRQIKDIIQAVLGGGGLLLLCSKRSSIFHVHFLCTKLQRDLKCSRLVCVATVSTSTVGVNTGAGLLRPQRHFYVFEDPGGNVESCSLLETPTHLCCRTCLPAVCCSPCRAAWWTRETSSHSPGSVCKGNASPLNRLQRMTKTTTTQKHIQA